MIRDVHVAASISIWSEGHRGIYLSSSFIDKTTNTQLAHPPVPGPAVLCAAMRDCTLIHHHVFTYWSACSVWKPMPARRCMHCEPIHMAGMYWNFCLVYISDLSYTDRETIGYWGVMDEWHVMSAFHWLADHCGTIQWDNNLLRYEVHVYINIWYMHSCSYVY